MHTYEWEPKPVELEIEGKVETHTPLFEGKITVRAPKYTERIKYLKDATTQISDGELTAMDHADRAEKMIEIAKKHILEVSIKRIEDGYDFKDVEDLEVDIDAGVLLMQVASSVIEGVRLGKDLKKRSSEK